MANKEFVILVRSLAKIARWDQVTVIPDDNKMTVFNNGMPQGSIVVIFSGGQTSPISTDGAKLQWKKAQKNEKKNMTSEAMKRHMPKRIPCWTLKVWFPS